MTHETKTWIDNAVNLYTARLLIPVGATCADDCGKHPDAMRAGLAILTDPRYAPAQTGQEFFETIARTVAEAEAHYENGADPDRAMRSAVGSPHDPKRGLACATYFRARGMWDEAKGLRTKAERAAGPETRSTEEVIRAYYSR